MRSLALALVCSGLLAAQQAGLAEQRIEPGESFTLNGHVRPTLARAQDLGAVASSRLMPRMSVRFALTAAQNADLLQLIDAQQTRGNAQYHHWLTPGQFADCFGVTAETAQNFAAWLQGFGFTDIEIAPSRTSIGFTGTAGQANAAFHASIHAYLVDGESHIANATDPVLPKAFEGTIQSIAGLHDFHPKPQAIKAHFTDSVTGNYFLAPDDFTTIYDVKRLYAMGIDGTDQKIAVVGESDFAMSDVQAFRSAAGMPQKNPQIVLTGPDPGTNNGDEVEADLDLEWSGAIAKNATIIYVNSPMRSIQPLTLSNTISRRFLASAMARVNRNSRRRK